MESEHIDYKGYTIYPLPMMGGGEQWYGGYDIQKDGATIRVRRNIFPSFPYFSAARCDSIEHAKMEIENLVQI